MPASHGVASTRSRTAREPWPARPHRGSSPLVARPAYRGLSRFGQSRAGAIPHPDHRCRMMFPEEVPILTYHSLDDSGSPISTSPTLFRRQVELLHEAGFQTITLAELLAAWDGAGDVPR